MSEFMSEFTSRRINKLHREIINRVFSEIEDCINREKFRDERHRILLTNNILCSLISCSVAHKFDMIGGSAMIPANEICDKLVKEISENINTGMQNSEFYKVNFNRDTSA